MGSYEVFTSVQVSQSTSEKAEKLFETLVCLYTQRQAHAHTWKHFLVSEGLYRLSGITQQTVTIHSDCRHAVLCPPSNVCPPPQPLTTVMPCHYMSPHMALWTVQSGLIYWFLVMLGVPGLRDHSGSSDLAVCAWAKEGHPRPHGSPHQDPHLLGLWHESPRQEVRLCFRQ